LELEKLGVDRANFGNFITAEKNYLASLKKEPKVETIEVGYIERLLRLKEAECVPV
jgi:hypothetical protein